MIYRELRVRDIPLTQVAQQLFNFPQITANAGTIEDLMNAYDCVVIDLEGRDVAFVIIPTYGVGGGTGRPPPTWRACEATEFKGAPHIVQLSEDEDSPADALLAALVVINARKKDS